MSSFMNRTAGIMQQELRADLCSWMRPTDWSAWWGPDLSNVFGDAVLWPRPRWSGGANAFFGDGAEMNRWAPPPEVNGGQQMKKIIGITRDSTGAVLGSAIVQGFLTANEQFLRQLTSDAGGYFEFCSEYDATNHFLVAYKAGSPDVAGTTVNTLQPT